MINNSTKMNLYHNIQEEWKNDEKVVPRRNLKELFEDHMSYGKNEYSPKYLKSQELVLRLQNDFFGKYLSIGEITPRRAEEFIHCLMKRAPKGYKVHLRTIKAIFNREVEWDYLEKNPYGKIKPRKTQKSKPKYLTLNDFDKLISKEMSLILRDLFITAFNTGVRLNEVVNLRWKNVDLENKRITIGDEVFATKSRETRIVPINKTLHQVLQELRNKELKSEYVFPKNGEYKYSSDYISRKFKQYSREADLDEGIHFHSLRHSFATNLANRNVSIYYIKDLLGHSTVKTTEIYAQVDHSALTKAVEILDEAA